MGRDSITPKEEKYPSSLFLDSFRNVFEMFRKKWRKRWGEKKSKNKKKFEVVE